MPTRQQFNDYISSLGLVHFSSDELLVAVGPHDTRPDNPLPEEDLWPNVVPTVLMLDALRAEFGRPITITSAYRDVEYNRAVGGVTASQHLDFRALDFKCRGRSPEECANMLRSWRGRPFASPVTLPLVARRAGLSIDGLRVNETAQGTAFVFAGGLGTYQTFVHVDCRGTNRDWRGST
jgi:uncharacterized protein YcbK (DUF882 family)